MSASTWFSTLPQRERKQLLGVMHDMRKLYDEWKLEASKEDFTARVHWSTLVGLLEDEHDGGQEPMSALPYRVPAVREVPPPHRGPRRICPYCSCPLTIAVSDHRDPFTQKIVKGDGETYHTYGGRRAEPRACSADARLRTGFWPWSRCKLPGPHTHQTCIVCLGGWTCEAHEPEGANS